MRERNVKIRIIIRVEASSSKGRAILICNTKKEKESTIKAQRLGYTKAKIFQRLRLDFQLVFKKQEQFHLAMQLGK